MFTDLLAAGYEPHDVKKLYIHGTEKPNTWVDITDTLDAKVRALQQHVSQINPDEVGKWMHEWAEEEAKDKERRLRRRRWHRVKRRGKRQSEKGNEKTPVVGDRVRISRGQPQAFSSSSSVVRGSTGKSFADAAALARSY